MVFTWGFGLNYANLKTAGSAFLPWSLYRYARSKLCNALFAQEFHARYGRQGITCVSVHPGIIATGLWSESFSFAKDWGFVGEVFKRASRALPVFGFEGAETGVRGQLWGAFGRLGDGRGEVEGGEFYTPVGVKGQGSWAAYDEEEGRRLWEWSEREVEGYLR